MRITKVHVSGFKSLANFELELAPFTCLIGMNGCGKSTVLQFFDYISHVLSGEVEKWYEAREWEPGEELSASGATDISFRLEFEGGAYWSGRYDVKSRVCREEELRAGLSFVKVDESGGAFQGLRLRGIGEPRAGTSEWNFEPQEFAYSGSIVSVLRDETLSHGLAELKSFVRRIRCFDTLAPQNLRRRDRSVRDSIGHSGEHLASYFDSLPENDQTDVVNALLDFYPQLSQLQHVFTQELPGGWKELVIHEMYGSESDRKTRSRHINDGLLRLVAILSELRSHDAFLLFDEIENGINAELVEGLVNELLTCKAQVLVTTHSPLILNYLEEPCARQSVSYLYKGREGSTLVRRFFDIPSVGRKLDLMGPGEAFVDTDLIALTEELAAVGLGA